MGIRFLTKFSAEEREMMDEIVAVWTTVFGDVVPSFLVLQDRVPVRHLFFLPFLRLFYGFNIQIACPGHIEPFC